MAIVISFAPHIPMPKNAPMNRPSVRTSLICKLIVLIGYLLIGYSIVVFGSGESACAKIGAAVLFFVLLWITLYVSILLQALFYRNCPLPTPLWWIQARNPAEEQ